MAFIVTTSSIHCFDARAPVWRDGVPLHSAQCQVELEALVTQGGEAGSATTSALSQTTRRTSAASERPAMRDAPLGVDLRQYLPEGALIALMSDEGRLLAVGKGGALALDAVQPNAATRWRVAWEEAEGKWWLALQSVASGAYVRCHGGRLDCPRGGDDVGRWQQFECAVVHDDTPADGMGIPQESMPGLPHVDVVSALIIKSREDGYFVGSSQRTRLRAVSSHPAANCVFRIVVQVRSFPLVRSFVLSSLRLERISRSRPRPPLSSPLLHSLQDEYVVNASDLRFVAFAPLERRSPRSSLSPDDGGGRATAAAGDGAAARPCDACVRGDRYCWYTEEAPAIADDVDFATAEAHVWWSAATDTDEGEFTDERHGFPGTHVQPTGLVRLKEAGTDLWRVVDLGDADAVVLLRE
jgi:hypothetical protein